MKHNSLEQQKVIDARYLRSLIDAVGVLQEKTATIEGNITSGDLAELAAQVIVIQQQIQAIYNNGRLFGGNIFISETQPASPQANDVWLDLNLIRR